LPYRRRGSFLSLDPLVELVDGSSRKFAYFSVIYKRSATFRTRILAPTPVVVTGTHIHAIDRQWARRGVHFLRK